MSKLGQRLKLSGPPGIVASLNIAVDVLRGIEHPELIKRQAADSLFSVREGYRRRDQEKYKRLKLARAALGDPPERGGSL